MAPYIRFPLSGYLLLAVLAGCTGKKEGQSTENPPVITDVPLEAIDGLHLAQELLTFSSCQDVAAHLRKMALVNLDLDKQWQIESLKDYYSGGGRRAVATSSVAESASDSASSAGGASEKVAAPASHTTTNNQVENVEEGDFMKNTGTHIFQIAGSRVHIIKSWPADAMAVLAALSVDGEPYRLLLEGEDRLVVLAAKDRESEQKSGPADIYYGYYDRTDTLVHMVNISDKSAPKVEASYLVPGRVSESRRIGTSLRLISGQSLPMRPEGVEWLDYTILDDQSVPLAAKVAALNAHYEKNKALINALSLDFWLSKEHLPRDLSAAADTREVNDAVCRSIHSTNATTAGGLTHVTTINTATKALSSTILTTAVNDLYMSEANLYLVTPLYAWDPSIAVQNTSFVHKFDISNPDQASYSGSGQVPGTPLNQFAMDEYEGNLRIATTIYENNSQDSWGWSSGYSYSKIFVLGQDEQGLGLRGESPKLGESERIYSVRYHGAWGYVVTFRQTDPLYTVDLSDVSAPKIVGELKVPGFSSYIHLLDNEHLLTVGRDATAEGRVLGTKISIFDVSDKSKPREAASLMVDDGSGSFSEAQWDHKAFTFYKEKGLLAIPLAGYSQTSGSGYRFESRLHLFKIADLTISAAGSLDLGELQDRDLNSWYCWNEKSSIRRSIFADEVVYAIGNGGIKSALSADTKQILGGVTFPAPDECSAFWSRW